MKNTCFLFSFFKFNFIFYLFIYYFFCSNGSLQTCSDNQSVGKRKDNKQVFILGDSIIKDLHG